MKGIEGATRQDTITRSPNPIAASIPLSGNEGVRSCRCFSLLISGGRGLSIGVGEVLEMMVNDVMTEGCVTVPSTATLADCVTRMLMAGTGSVVDVADDGQVLVRFVTHGG
jgi:hypothetical protein